MSSSTILLIGGTGKVASRIAPLLSANRNQVIVASRSGKSPALPGCRGVKFDWSDSKTYSVPLEETISAVFLVSPTTLDCLPPMKEFIDLAIEKGVKRFVLLSASLMEVADGPAMSQVSNYIVSLGVDYAILRPTWFMENFSEVQHLQTILKEDKIYTATGEGKVPFVSANDIAAVAFRALVDEKPHNTDHLILGSDLLSYDDVAELLTKKLGRQITHVKLTEEQLAAGMALFLPQDYASVLAQLDTAIKNGAENRTNDVVEKVTGKKPIRFEDFVDECVKKGVWERK